MGTHRALLLFVPRYDADEWPNLDYLDGEYEDVRAALVDQGYEIDEGSGCGEFRAVQLVVSIGRFIADARRGERLLVYLSGHGFSYGGRHWFAGADSHVELLNEQSLTATNVRLGDDWARNAAATVQVMFVVDACRDRLPLPGEGRGSQVGSFPEVSRGTDRLSYFMACAPGGTAGVAGDAAGPDGQYSLFTQALREVLADAQGELPADRLRDLMAPAMEDLRTRQRNPPKKQEPRLSGERGSPRFPVLPVARTSAGERRVRLLREHPVWEGTTDQAEAAELRAEAETVVASLTTWLQQQKEALEEDPWLDWEADQRAAERLTELLASLPEEVRFSPAEAALLALGPALFHGFRVRLLARADRDIGSGWLQYPRLHRQAVMTTDPSRRARDRRVVEAWVRHRTHATPGDVQRDALDQLHRFLMPVLAGTDALGDLCAVQRIAWLFRAMQHGGGALAGPSAEALAGPVGDADFRPQTVGMLLCAAQIMALDRYEMPAVLVEHIGGHGRIGLAHVRRTVENAKWKIPRGPDEGSAARLSAECGHQAVMVALQERVKFLDGLLCADLAVPGLTGLPTRASGVEVLPERDPGSNEYKFFPVATRFGLDGTRVRDLLVGDQLYPDRYLAVRELYQNAMDACQVRRAREHVIRWPGGPEFDGRIRIVQGAQGNRRYLDCYDNGSGMGRGELLGSFAQGGVRLAHLATFQAERMKWESLGIRFHQNSRFGIGVLSYFMLAEEIEVITRQFKPGGKAGQALQVTVAGPDHLFQIKPYEPDEHGDVLEGACGTRIRWWLREDLPDFSCVRALRSVLGVAEFHTFAKYGEDEEVWEPDEYVSRPDTGTAPAIDATGTIVPGGNGEVFWCEHGGALLVDGIAVEGRWFVTDERTGERRSVAPMQIQGAVINLRGPVVRTADGEKPPRLSVDRSHVVDEVTEKVFALLRRRKDVERLAGSELLSQSWLFDLADGEARLADAVVQGLVNRGAGLNHDDGEGPVDMARTGYFTADRELRAAWLQRHPPARQSPNGLGDDGNKATRLPEHLALWRYAAHFPNDVSKALGELCPDGLLTARLRPALPSDAAVLGSEQLFTGLPSWDTATELGALHFYARELHQQGDWVVRRLAELGQQPRTGGGPPELTSSAIQRLASRDGDGLPPWLRPGDPVRTVSVLAAAQATALSPQDAVRHLAGMGFDTRHCEVLAEGSPESARLSVLLSDRLDGAPPWQTTRVGSLPVTHLIAAAKKTGMAMAELRSVFATHGYKLPEPHHLDTQGPRWRYTRDDSSEPLRAGLAHVYRLAQLASCPLDEAVLCLQACGYDVGATVRQGMALPPHAELLTRPLSDGEILDLDREVTLLDLHNLAEWLDLSLDEVRDRLASLSVEVPRHRLPAALGDSDLVLLTRASSVPGKTDQQGLDPHRCVPLAHVAIVAARLGIPVASAHHRLIELGMTVQPLPEPQPEWFDEASERRISLPWIPYDSLREPVVVPLAEVICLAAERGWSLEETVSRLRVRGLDIPENVHARLAGVTERDRALLSRNHNGQAPWISLKTTVSTTRVVRAARALGLSVAEVRTRLVELGADIAGLSDDPEEMIFAPFDAASRRRIRTDLNAVVESGRPVPAAHVWAIAEAERETVLMVAQRLQAAGLDVQDAEYPEDRPKGDELLLLRENASPNGPWLSLDDHVGLEHLLVAAHRLGTTVVDIAERLKRFGLRVRPLADTVHDAWARVPRASDSGERFGECAAH
ncbi:caspase family protein [Streptomyces sp. FIT100]|uniref:wHTH domain-containing protein n=1 Tax=Streptomyces sp. FIT100 TaxID=2837956 RepID=UPI0021C9F095|nr:caspase family protein [Streptomyces sp. FIT100]UUN28693.1 hypothetical protein KK483_21635 [Streptomyces sp. FIT100]